MTIALAKNMACSTTDLSDDFWSDSPVLFFRLELPVAIVYKTTTAFVDFDFTFLFID